MIWATVSSWLFLLTVWSFSIFGCKEYNEPDFDVGHLVMSMCSIFSCVVGRGCLLWPVHLLGRTLLAFVLLHSVLQGQICLLLPEFLDFLLLHSSPPWWRGHLFWVLFLDGLVGLHRTIHLQLLQCYWLRWSFTMNYLFLVNINIPLHSLPSSQSVNSWLLICGLMQRGKMIFEGCGLKGSVFSSVSQI